MELDEAYEVLQVRPGADEPVVRSAFRALTKRSHPDAGGHASDFRTLKQALDCIASAGFPSAETPSPGTRLPPKTIPPSQPNRASTRRGSGSGELDLPWDIFRHFGVEWVPRSWLGRAVVSIALAFVIAVVFFGLVFLSASL